ncbi:MAG: hypothetical protein H7A44_09765 [Opitutaceae bacterium]|nr:hypothetical protein [Cephaloticoccus sp.]MCP5530714.1 hypothetical protein [Opitutaceae bacterium]
MHRIALIILLLFSGVGLAAAHPLAGTWRLQPDLGTNLAAWRALDLIVEVDGNEVTLTRQFAAGRRTFQDVTKVDLSKTAAVIPVELWPDARYLGANIGGDKTKTVSGQWIGDGNVLRLNTDVVLATQQGEHPVNVLGTYTVSTNGERLTLIEVRSTRTQPLVFVFKRLEGAEARRTGTAE